MKKSRYTDEQIAFELHQAETGTPVAEVIRRMGIAEQTFANWKRRYGGLGPSEVRRLKHERIGHKGVVVLCHGRTKWSRLPSNEHRDVS
jgi:transposase-like protein